MMKASKPAFFRGVGSLQAGLRVIVQHPVRQHQEVLAVGAANDGFDVVGTDPVRSAHHLGASLSQVVHGVVLELSAHGGGPGLTGLGRVPNVSLVRFA